MNDIGSQRVPYSPKLCPKNTRNVSRTVLGYGISLKALVNAEACQ